MPYKIKDEDLDAVSRLMPFVNQMADCFGPVWEGVDQHPDLLELFAAVFAGRACSFGGCNGADTADVHMAAARLLAVGNNSTKSPSSPLINEDGTMTVPSLPRLGAAQSHLERGAEADDLPDQRLKTFEVDVPRDAGRVLISFEPVELGGDSEGVRGHLGRDLGHECSFRCDEGADTPVDRSVEGRADESSATGGAAGSVADRPTLEPGRLTAKSLHCADLSAEQAGDVLRTVRSGHRVWSIDHDSESQHQQERVLQGDDLGREDLPTVQHFFELGDGAGVVQNPCETVSHLSGDEFAERPAETDVPDLGGSHEH